jgi:hypothetical protein
MSEEKYGFSADVDVQSYMVKLHEVLKDLNVSNIKLILHHYELAVQAFSSVDEDAFKSYYS